MCFQSWVSRIKDILLLIVNNGRAVVIVLSQQKLTGRPASMVRSQQQRLHNTVAARGQMRKRGCQAGKRYNIEMGANMYSVRNVMFLKATAGRDVASALAHAFP